jgi:hypothetical protein
MFQVITSKPKQLQALLEQILFRPDNETDGAEFTAVLSVSEIQTFLQIDDDVLIAWLDANKLRPHEDQDPIVNMLDDVWEICDKLLLKRYAIGEALTPLLTHFQPGLLTWEIEDRYDREGGSTTRLFRYTPLEELDFDNHMDWYAQLQKEYQEANEKENANG